MKHLVLFSIFLFISIGCIKKVVYDIDELKEDETSRDEVFNEIINDKEMLAIFLNKLTSNEDAMNQLIMNDEAMHLIFELQNMHYMAQVKPEIMLLMMNNLAHITQNDTSVRMMMYNLPQIQSMAKDQEWARR